MNLPFYCKPDTEAAKQIAAHRAFYATRRAQRQAVETSPRNVIVLAVFRARTSPLLIGGAL